MHKFVHNLAFAVVLLHMSVGCCWHHAHDDCRGHDPDHDGFEHHEHHHHGHHHHACQGGHDHPPKPVVCWQHGHDAPESDCTDAVCVFVVPERSSPVRPAEFSAPLVIGAALVPAAQSPAAAPMHLDGLPPPGGTPALRVHLLNQILLI